jgi:predicted permease
VTSFRILLSRALKLFRRSKVEADLDEEIRSHIQMQEDDYRADGMSAEEAHYAAIRDFGGRELIKEAYRDRYRFPSLESVFQDVTHSLRGFRKNPGFAVVAVLTLALGIGANTTIFTLLDPILLRPLPYPDSEKLVRVYRTSAQSNSWPHSAPNFLDYRTLNQSFTQMAAFTWTNFNLSSPGEPAERAQGLTVTADFLPLLGVQPLLGRVFTEEEDKAGAAPVVMLSHRFWTTRFGGDRGIVGRTVQLNGREARIVGVMPDSFENPMFFGRVDMWSPLALTDVQRKNRNNNYLNIVGRLRPGVMARQAESDVRSLASRIQQAHGETKSGESIRIEDFKRSITPVAASQVSWFTLALTIVVLLIACVNLANFQLARTTARAREFALRAALGGGRGRLIRQSLTDSLVLSLIGGSVALLPSVLTARLVARHAFRELPDVHVSFEFQFFAFAFACSMFAGIVFGLAPAWIASRANVSHMLKSDLRAGRGSRSQRRLRHALIAAEVAFALVLLGGTGTLVHALRQIVESDPGWQVDGVLVGRIGLDGPNYASPRQQAQFLDLLQTRLAALPGVQNAAISLSSPTWIYNANTPMDIEGREETALLNFEMISPPYFETLGIPIKQGRAFSRDDRFGRTEVVIINEAMAKRYWPNESPLGKRIDFSNAPEHHWKEIVGVVGDVRFPSAMIKPDTDFTFYRPIAQNAIRGALVELRTAGAPETLIPSVRKVAEELDKDQPIFELKSARSAIRENLQGFDVAGKLLTAIAVVGLLLSAVGIFGVISYSVSQRTGEIGVRMALGAEGSQVIWLVLKQGLFLSAIGVVIGLIGAIGVTRVLSVAVPGLPSSDPLVMLAMTAVLLIVAILACALPARRASAIDPITALRHE